MRTTNPVNARARTAVAVVLGAGLAASTLAACSDSGADEATIRSPQEWCSVAVDVDALIGDRTSRNTIHHQLQEVYAAARPLVVRLTEGLEQVDPGHRDDVEVLGDLFLEVADVLAEAPDQRAAEAAVEAVFAQADPAAEAGAAWVTETCEPD